MNVLEDIVAAVVRNEHAAGAVLLIITKDARAEVISALPAETDVVNLAAEIRRMADEIESGSGMPLGSHLQTL